MLDDFLVDDAQAEMDFGQVRAGRVNLRGAAEQHGAGAGVQLGP
jgi:hypothetical protein